MDCLNCGTWNPTDKSVCWRCQTELPRPVEKKKRKSFTIFGMPAWVLIIAAVLMLMPFMGQCFGGGLPVP